jgi:hypothetical protein
MRVEEEERSSWWSALANKKIAMKAYRRTYVDRGGGRRFKKQ